MFLPVQLALQPGKHQEQLGLVVPRSSKLSLVFLVHESSIRIMIPVMHIRLSISCWFHPVRL